MEGSSKLERFAQISIATRLKNFHTFACRVYAKQNEEQNSNGSRLSHQGQC